MAVSAAIRNDEYVSADAGEPIPAAQRKLALVKCDSIKRMLHATPGDDLDRAGVAIIREAEALLESLKGRDAAPRNADEKAKRAWNEECFVADVVWRARREIGDFEKLHNEIRAFNGMIELLYHAMDRLANERDSRDADGVNITVVRDAINDARGRFGAVYSATGILAELDKEA